MRKPIEMRRVTNYFQILAGRRPVDAVFFDDAQPAEIDAALESLEERRRVAREVHGMHGTIRVIAWRRPPSGHSIGALPLVGVNAGEVS